MKTIQMLTLTVAIIAFSGLKSFAQDLANIDIKTSSQCEMCKDRLESGIGIEPGVKEVNLNLENKVLSVKYNPKKTNPDKLRLAVSKLGYDADGRVAMRSHMRNCRHVARNRLKKPVAVIAVPEIRVPAEDINHRKSDKKNRGLSRFFLFHKK